MTAMSMPKTLLGAIIGAIPFAMAAATASAQVVMDPLHGYCAGAGQCIDNGTNSPTSNNPPSNFGFTISPGPQTGDFLLKILTPNNQAAGPSFTLTGPSGTATLLPQSPWTSGNLATFLGDVPGASPDNPIGAFLPSTVAIDPGATGFNVYEADLGTLTLQDAANPNVSPLENITSGTLPAGSYIVGFLNTGTAAAPDWIATANSGAIFETSGPTAPPRVPEPGTLALLGSALAGFGAFARRRRRST